MDVRKTRGRSASLLERFERSGDVGYFDEQALPSYLSPHAVVRHCFWRQLEIAAAQLEPQDTLLDFGCGLGAGFPYWEQCCREFHAYDPSPRVREALGDRVIGDLEAITSLKVDAIVALNVLEHVDDLGGVLERFAKMLRPNGRVIVSSPTENWNYRLARRAGGWKRGFRGEYHLWNADDVERDLRRVFDVAVVARLYFPLTFFRMVVCTPR